MIGVAIDQRRREKSSDTKAVVVKMQQCTQTDERSCSTDAVT